MTTVHVAFEERVRLNVEGSVFPMGRPGGRLCHGVEVGVYNNVR
jgi:hypothetical protein